MLSYPIEVAGTLTRVLESGHGDRRVLFLHGVGARADRWLRNLDALAASGAHVFAVDLPGHGFAAKGPGFRYTAPGYAAFIRELLDTTVEPPVALVGTSLGGHIAATVACENCRVVESLILVGSVGLVPLGAARRRAIASLVRDRSRDGIEKKLRNVLVNPSDITDDWVWEEYRINNSPGADASFEMLGRYFEDAIDGDVIGPRLAPLVDDIPVLLVWGSADATVPLRMGEAAHLLLAGSTLEVIQGAGHAPYLECYEEFNRSVSDFLGLKKARAHR
jgi:pimeloyl-ACP methyl ester carboxylesterase